VQHDFTANLQRMNCCKDPNSWTAWTCHKASWTCHKAW